MSNQDDFEERVREVKARAYGHWTGILTALGVDPKILNRKNQPCPMCGGTDRFQYTDKFQEGNYYCRSCGAGGGLKLAQHILGLRFGELLERIEQQVGRLPSKLVEHTGPSAQRMKQLCQRIWHEARPITAGDEVDRYLRNRGLVLEHYPRTLRFHPELGYYRKDGSGKSVKVATYPAMLGCVQGPDGHGITLHRTYLSDGAKALGEESKKLLSSGIEGAAVRLQEPTDELGITEGVENGLAVQLATGKPVWAALNCGNLERIWIPDTVRRICIYGDNDADGGFEGQASAYVLARRLMRESKRVHDNGLSREVQVFIPRRSGTDWANVWFAKVASLRQAA
jgi:putative DNA primase/helicase